MDFIIAFFRDVLVGPLYYVVVSICSILICSCIGYLSERYLNQKKEIEAKMNSQLEVNQPQSAGTQDGAASTDVESSPSAEGDSGQIVTSVQNASQELTAVEEDEELNDPAQEVNYAVVNVGTEELLDDD